jgi:hypothetical protein
LSLSALSAYGLDALLLHPHSEKFGQRWGKGLQVAGVLLGSVALWGLMSNPPSLYHRIVRFAFAHNDKTVSEPLAKFASLVYPHSMLSVFVCALFLCASGWWLGCAAKRKFSPPALTWLAIALVSVDLFLFGIGFNPVTSPKVFHAPSQVHQKVCDLAPNYRVLTPLSSIDRWWDEFANYSYFGSTRTSFVVQPIHCLVPNIGMAYKTYNAEGYDALRFQPYDRVLRKMERAWEGQKKANPKSQIPNLKSPDFLDLLSVRAVITATGKEQSPWRIHVNPRALPRAFTCDSLSAWRDGKGNVALRDDVNQVTLETKLSQPSTIVLTDVNYPGWRVSLNGRAQRQNVSGIVRSVQGKRGANRAQFVYRPTAFLVGAFITLSALGCVVALSAGREIPFRRFSDDASTQRKRISRPAET